MKTKNNLTKGIIIGICGIVLPLILMGTTYTTEKKNQYEIHMTNGEGKTRGLLLNTETGDVWYLNVTSRKKEYMSEQR